MRLDEAKSLLEHWVSGAGLTIWPGFAPGTPSLKACIIKALMATDAFPEQGVFQELLHTQQSKSLWDWLSLQDELQERGGRRCRT